MSAVEYMMHRAVPVLFWVSVMLFFGAIATTMLLEHGVSPVSGDGSILSADSVLRGIVQGLNAAAWPFTGAGLIWTLQRNRSGR